MSAFVWFNLTSTFSSPFVSFFDLTSAFLSSLLEESYFLAAGEFVVVFAFFSTVFAELLETTFFALDCETVFVRFFKADALGTLVFTLEIFLGSAFLGDLVTFLAEITFLSLESFFVIFFDEFALEFLGDGAFVEFLSETILDLVIAFVAFLEEAIFTDFDAPFVPFLTGLVAFLAELAFVDFGAFLLELPLLPFSVLVTFLLAVIFFGETC